MKAVILENENKEKIIEHFVAYGIEDFIVFGKDVDEEYYKLNGIGVITLNPLEVEGAKEKLSKIKGSLNSSFFLVYSDGVIYFDLDDIINCHRNAQGCVTLIEKDSKICALLLESEIFDYLPCFSSLEREALERVAQDGEMQFYK